MGRNGGARLPHGDSRPRPQSDSGHLHVPLRVPDPEPITSGDGTEGEGLVLAYVELRSRVPAWAVLKEKNEGYSACQCTEGRPAGGAPPEAGVQPWGGRGRQAVGERREVPGRQAVGPARAEAEAGPSVAARRNRKAASVMHRVCERGSKRPSEKKMPFARPPACPGPHSAPGAVLGIQLGTHRPRPCPVGLTTLQGSPVLHKQGHR